MADLVERRMALWLAPPADDDEAVAAFRALYTEPVQVNGAPMTAAALVARARMLHATYDGLHHELVDRAQTADKVVIAFRMRGAHVGTLPNGASASRRVSARSCTTTLICGDS